MFTVPLSQFHGMFASYSLLFASYVERRLFLYSYIWRDDKSLLLNKMFISQACDYDVSFENA